MKSEQDGKSKTLQKCKDKKTKHYTQVRYQSERETGQQGEVSQHFSF